LISTVHQRFAEVLVVYLATQHAPELERAVRQLGVLYYTEKPPDSDVLHRLISAAFAPVQTQSQPTLCS
jgi:DNA-binding NarL/FixJ family response regulator